MKLHVLISVLYIISSNLWLNKLKSNPQQRACNSWCRTALYHTFMFCAKAKLCKNFCRLIFLKPKKHAFKKAKSDSVRYKQLERYLIQNEEEMLFKALKWFRKAWKNAVNKYLFHKLWLIQSDTNYKALFKSTFKIISIPLSLSIWHYRVHPKQALHELESVNSITLQHRVSKLGATLLLSNWT